jgi:hypothetical protein
MIGAQHENATWQELPGPGAILILLQAYQFARHKVMYSRPIAHSRVREVVRQTALRFDGPQGPNNLGANRSLEIGNGNNGSHPTPADAGAYLRIPAAPRRVRRQYRQK